MALEWLRRFWQERPLRRRLRQIEDGVRALAREPGRLAEISGRLGVSAAVLEELVAPREPAAAPKLGPLEAMPLAAATPWVPVEAAPLAVETALPVAADALAERARRSLVLLLDHPVARRDLAATSDWVVELAEAVKRRDPAGLERWEAKLAEDGFDFACGADRVELVSLFRYEHLTSRPRTSMASIAAAESLAQLADAPPFFSHDLEAVGRGVEPARSWISARSHFGVYAVSANRPTDAKANRLSFGMAADEEWMKAGLVRKDRQDDLTVAQNAFFLAQPPLVEPFATLEAITLYDISPNSVGSREAEEPSLLLERDRSAPIETMAPAVTMTVDGEEPAVEVLLEGGWEALNLHVRLETRSGDRSAAREPLAPGLVDSLPALVVAGAGTPEAAADLLVVVRKRAARLELTLVEPAVLDGETLEQALAAGTREEGIALPDLFWSLRQGFEVRGATEPGGPFREGVDVAWVSPVDDERSAFLERAMAKVLHFPSRSRAMVQVMSSRLARFVEDAGRRWNQEPWNEAEIFDATEYTLTEISVSEPAPAPVWVSQLKVLIESPWLAEDPALAVELSGVVFEHGGTLSWDACLTLANSRARCHRFLDAGKTPAWHVRVDVRPGHDGAIEIPFAVVEQPLSSRFRTFFEEQDLAGRASFLWQLVRYAAELHVSVLSITAADTRRHVHLREEDLWRSLNRSEVSRIATR